MGKEVDPSDVGKHQDIIKKAQAEMARTDVLVCGNCHQVLHFVEEFVEHRNAGGCSKESTLRDHRETKPKVWAFLLWKAAQRNDANNETTNSWKLFQMWTKLDEAVRETWIVAGRTIQSFARMGQGNLQEMPVKITKTVVDTTNDTLTETRKNALANKTPGPAAKPATTAQNRTPLSATKPNQLDNVAKRATPNAIGGAVQRSPITAAKPSPAGTSPAAAAAAKNVPRIAQKTIANDETETQTIEKILAKRFNPRRREHEYLIKWDKFTHDQNTWEPQSHLATCAQLLETFEKQLARQKQQRAEMAARAAAANEASQKTDTAAAAANAASASAAAPSPQRPLRTSKAKAMDQVKQWCADNEEEAKKRKLDDSSDFENDHQPASANTSATEPPSKVVRRDPLQVSASSAAIIRAGQTSGGVKITPVPNKQATTTTTTVQSNAAKLNGQQSSHILKQTTGIIKKPPSVVTNAIVSPKPTEAQIRVVQKGDNTTSGVVRIGAAASALGTGATTLGSSPTVVRRIVGQGQQQQQQQQQQRAVGTPIKTVPASGTVGTTPQGTTIIRQTTTPAQRTIQNSNTKASIAARAPPANIQAVRSMVQGAGTVGTTVVQRTIVQGGQQRQIQQTVQRTSLSPGGQTSKAVISRVVKGGPVRQQGGQQQQQVVATQEDKLAALQRHGDLKITRKQLPVSTTIKQVKNEVEQPEISLCPVTGKVITHGKAAEEEEEQQQQQEQQELEQQQLLQQQQQQQQLQEQQQQQQQQQQMMAEMPANLGPAGEIQQMMVNEDGSPILVTGEDGTVYQVAGKNEQGQTILIAQGGDGEQQCVYVTSDDSELNGLMGHAQQQQQQQQVDGQDAAALIAAMEGGQLDGGAQQQQQQQQISAEQTDLANQQQQQFAIKQDLDGAAAVATALASGESVSTDATQPLAIATDSDSQDGQITAEVVQADLPSPGGTRRVVLLLPDGSFMMTEVSDEQYQALNLVA